MTPEQLDRFPALLDGIQKRVKDAARTYEGADIDDARTAIAAAWDLLAEVERLTAELDIAEKHIERGNDETMKAYSQVRHLLAEVERLRAQVARDKPVLDAAHAVVKVWRQWRTGRGKEVIPIKALACAVDVHALAPVAAAFDAAVDGRENPAPDEARTVVAPEDDAPYEQAALEIADVERAERERVAAELVAWADTFDDSNPARATLRRHIHMCARRIAPKMTNQEVAEALLRGDFVACQLDEAGRPIQPAASEEAAP